MSNWTDPEKWQQYLESETCPVCLNGRPTDLIAELEASFLIAGHDGPMKGYCFLLLKQHAVELYDLSEDEAAAFMRDIQKSARAVHEVTAAVKLNYEIHGNTIPHLHLHIFPRYKGDAFEWKPIDPRSIQQPVYGPGEFEMFTERLKTAFK
jgi:diadenosine tetraphosphate (Ap4A) HIT family hydrolase